MSAPSTRQFNSTAEDYGPPKSPECYRIDGICDRQAHCAYHNECCAVQPLDPKILEEPKRNRLNEIGSLVRTLTYGEMIQLAEAVWKISEGKITKDTLPMTLWKWSTNRDA